MKRSILPAVAGSVLLLSCLIPLRTTLAQQSDQLEVAVGVICTDVVDREPVGIDSTFTALIEKLVCFTNITGAETPCKITHVWYFGEIERARVELSVESKRWRTRSSKRIQVHEVGSWRVDVLDEAGTVLKSIRFEITQP